MKKILIVAFLSLGLMFMFSSCTRVAPNHYGVMMENYGTDGKADYHKVQGKVSTMSPGTELFEIPAWEQRAEFTNDDDTKRTLHLKASDNTEFSASPLYSYKVIENRVVDVVFQNSRLGSGDGFMRALENNVLEPRIYDIIKEESKMYTTEQLMATGGGIAFEKHVQNIVKTEFEKAGLELKSFAPNLDFSKKVREKIDSRNEVNTNISVLDQKIAEQKKTNELESLKAEQNIIRSRGLTPQVIEMERIRKWNGVLPIGNQSIQFMKSVN